MSKSKVTPSKSPIQDITLGDTLNDSLILEKEIKETLLQMDSRLEKSSLRFQSLIYFIVFLVISTQIGFFFIVQKPDINWNFFQNNNSIESKNTKPKSDLADKNSETKTISSFTNNDSITDLGGNLNVKSDQISAKNVSDCQTQVVPDQQNGCGFSLLTSQLGLSDPGIMLKSIRFDATLGDDEKIDIAIKNFEKGTISTSIATIKQSELVNKTPLPPFLSQVDSIHVRFWNTKSEPKITQIVIEYSSVDKLKPVSGSIQTLLVADKKGFIYSDEDGNGILNKGVDSEWKCQVGFPGVKAVEIDKDSHFTLFRDDECYTGPKGSNWDQETDSKTNQHTLPAGKWLLDIDGRVYTFEIKSDQDIVILDLEDK